MIFFVIKKGEPDGPPFLVKKVHLTTGLPDHTETQPA
jgi:hypothetical protein